MQTKVLVVEDEPDLLDLIEYNLSQAGFQVFRSTNGLDALEMIRKKKPDLVVLDLMLPGLNGKEVCLRLRADGETRNLPIVMLTAKAEEVDRIVGFEIGADDYLTKPFSHRELILRIRAVLKRSQGEATQPVSLHFPGLIIDPDRHRVEIQGDEIDLTATEFKLLIHLAGRAGRVQTREMLLDEVWGYPYEGYARTVDTHIRRLRKKMGPQKEYIETIRGVGYRFREKAQA
ncbi:MAG: response regulator transcription factor [Proteobacteria bacterium]|nr:response regulator transcription factor [Pseudomonadota bacterium]